MPSPTPKLDRLPRSPQPRTPRLRSPEAIQTQPQRLLLGVAEQAGIGDPASCRIILSILLASRAIQRSFKNELFSENASETRFGTLVAIYALEPLPATADFLALQAGTSSHAIKQVIDDLEARGLVTWGPQGWDTQTPIQLTELGGQVTVMAVHRFLQVASDLAGAVSDSDREAVVRTCARIEGRAADHSL
jgi:DNA-binding MarR family transcriptional regulator